MKQQIKEHKRYASKLIDHEKLLYTHADIIIPINIFRIQGNNSTVCGYFRIGFIDCNFDWLY